MEILSVNGKRDSKKLMSSILVPVIGGTIVGALTNADTQEKYEKLKKPSFSPPPWVFPAVWTALYATMGLAGYRAAAKAELRHEKAKVTLPYDVQLGLNFLWSFLFFKWRLRGAALAEMALLLGTLTLTSYEFFKQDKLAGALMVPYVAWVSFALGLNYSIWQLNK